MIEAVKTVKSTGGVPSRAVQPSFEERVWSVICSIPPGRVMTYGQIARILGTKAYRAVGRACRNSPGLPTVPCHRVVDSRGMLHGFNGGLPRKKALLEAEGIPLRRRELRSGEDFELVDLRSRLMQEVTPEAGGRGNAAIPPC
jgi:methylated-DNA-[protein]-cysteine S-methyltransferase